MRRISSLALLCLSALLPLATFAQTQDTLRVHGSNTLGARLVPALAEAWLRAEGYERIERRVPAENELYLEAVRGGERRRVEMAAHGSSTGFAALLEARADVAMSSRPVNDEELARSAGLGPLDAPAQEAVVALDGVAVVVHPSNPLRHLSLPQVRAVFDGELRDWRELGAPAGPIVLHARDAKSGTFETFRHLVLGGRSLRRDARRYEDSHALAAAVASDPLAIGFVGVSAVGEARALALAESGHALAPTAASVAVEDYALSRRLFLYTPQTATAAARDFVEFALSPAGQRVVEASGFVAQDIRPYPAPASASAPPEYLALTRDAQRLSLNFRFGAGSRMLDSKIVRDAERLARFLRQPERRGQPLLLIGFADASEVSPYLALTLSNDRVDLVARLLQEHGVAAQRSRGLGGTMPVADNATAAGRQRNRRVEVWLGQVGAARAAAAKDGMQRGAGLEAAPR